MTPVVLSIQVHQQWLDNVCQSNIRILMVEGGCITPSIHPSWHSVNKELAHSNAWYPGVDLHSLSTDPTGPSCSTTIVSMDMVVFPWQRVHEDTSSLFGFNWKSNIIVL